MVIDRSVNPFAERAWTRLMSAQSTSAVPAKAPLRKPPVSTAVPHPTAPTPPANSPLTAPAYGPSRPSLTAAAPKATDRSENRMHAVGLANVGRSNVYTLNSGASIYNGVKSQLEDPKVHAQIRAFSELQVQRFGGDVERRYDEIIGALKGAMNEGLRMMKSATGNMKMNFEVTGRPLTKDAAGFYRTGDYTQSASGAGWSVTVNSRGEATAIANGVDVSAQVDGSRSEGFRWSDIGRPGQTISIAA